LKEGRDFFLCFSPERIDPGNKKFVLSQIPKVVGGVSSLAAELAARLYKTIFATVVPVSSARTAEMTKLLENTFRIVNIALVNELTQAAHSLGVNIWEAIEAAETKPFGYMPFYPGPGVGGHCIGIDPVYLSWKAARHGFHIRSIDLARDLNAGMPHYVVERLQLALTRHGGRLITRSKILVLGVSYKRDVADTRESPAFEVVEELAHLGARVDYHDPYVPTFVVNSLRLQSKRLSSRMVATYDAVLIVTNHSRVNYRMIARQARLVLDARNALRDLRGENIVRL
jgi:UDP-N-acetyl-D-glucosamine dehydrogenase